MKHWPVKGREISQSVLRKCKLMRLMILDCLLKLYHLKLNLKWYPVTWWKKDDSMSICVHIAEQSVGYYGVMRVNRVQYTF
jgi:hypothetical protein